MTKKISQELILDLFKKKVEITTKDITSRFEVSRPYASAFINGLVKNGELLKIGKGLRTFYILPRDLDKISARSSSSIKLLLMNKGLDEMEVFSDIEESYPVLSKLKENVKNIFTYAFSEMLNNAIEHSSSQDIKIIVDRKENNMIFSIEDHGIGVFRNVMRKRGLSSELEAMQDLMKGKVTTQPHHHSGEGIFFTSKVGDWFSLQSFEYEIIVDNKINDIFFRKIESPQIGTKVAFSIGTDSSKNLNDPFKKYASGDDGYSFDKTEVKVKLYTVGGLYVSRSQARRILAELDKFKSIILDFDKVPLVGQAFADEVFRVFKTKHPDITIIPINMDKGVEFMIDRVEKPK
jgi:anti-sigma regulatory factor (Ser/Thr protein kinase)